METSPSKWIPTCVFVPADRPGLGVDDHVRASGLLERGQRVRGERRLARRRTAAELVEALPATRRAEDDDEHGEKCECGGEAAHGADIGRPARGPETRKGCLEREAGGALGIIALAPGKGTLGHERVDD